MLRKLLEKFDTALAGTEDFKDSRSRERLVRQAAAALMVEVARADHEYSEDEFSLLVQLIEKEFDLDAEAALALSERAAERVEESVSLHEFTHVLHQHFSDEEKSRLIGALWVLAFADGRLDMYEDALVLKVSDLLYVPRGEVMRLKAAAQGNA